MNMRATFITAKDAGDWRNADRFVLGGSSDSTASAVAAVGISLGSEAKWRVDLLPVVGHSCFQDVRRVGELIYIGYGEQVAVFSPRTGDLASHSLDGYFGRLFTSSDIESLELGSPFFPTSTSRVIGATSCLYFASRCTACRRLALHKAAKMGGSKDSAETASTTRKAKTGSAASVSRACQKRNYSGVDKLFSLRKKRSSGKPARRSTSSGRTFRSLISARHPMFKEKVLGGRHKAPSSVREQEMRCET